MGVSPLLARAAHDEPMELRSGLLGTVIVATTLLLAGCTTGSAKPGVANLGSTGTSTPLAASAAGNSGPPPSAKLQKAQLSYSRCMRGHGVVDFPDPKSGGGYPSGYMHSIDPNSSAYVNATKDCRPLEGAAGMAPWTKAQMEAHDAVMLKIAQCMRAHGIVNFPDPDAQGGFSMQPGTIDESSPQYAAAAKKCNGPPGLPRGAAGG